MGLVNQAPRDVGKAGVCLGCHGVAEDRRTAVLLEAKGGSGTGNKG